MKYYHSSPLLFLRPAEQSRLAGRRLEFVPSLKEVEMLSFFSEAQSVESATEAGFESEMIEIAVSKGLLLECDKDGFGSGSTWEVYNLQRAAFLMFSGFSNASNLEAKFKLPLTRSNHEFAADFNVLLKRRTERFFTEEPLSLAVLKELNADLNAAIGNRHWLSYRILVQSVEGLKAGIYASDINTGDLLPCVEEYTRKDLLECLHGQWWLNGGGVCFILIVSLEELAQKHVDNPESYFEMIVLLGALGQALVNSVTRHGLGTWMTPALSETLSAKILGLDSSKEEALYFFKVGIPERAAENREEKRTPI